MTERLAGRIVIYLRLSKEDERNSDESNSISSQRELIMDYIRKDRELSRLEVVECVDDGYTGKNMARPGMDRLLALIRSRQASVVIVKDMSRFSRDYLVLGQYTEQIFPFMGIRFIALNDHYDSDCCDGGIGGIDIAFKAMLYDFYSVDLSKKVKTAIRARKEKGEFTNVYAPYGYRKDPDDRHSLIIEPAGAEVVRRIFNDYANGKSMYRIARELNEENIDPPIIYYSRRDGREYRSRWKDSTPVWRLETVSRMLHDEIYTGTLVYNKSCCPEPGAPHSVLNPRKEWLRKENMYPAIIDRELFNKAAERYGRNDIYRRDTGTPASNRHFLTGKVVCGGCGHVMVHTRAKKQGKPGYFCGHRFYTSENSGCAVSIRDEDLEAVLSDLVSIRLRSIPDLKSIAVKNKELMEESIKEASERLRRMSRTWDNLQRDLFRAYENYKEGVTGKETYLQQKSAYEEMLEKLKANIKKQEEAIAAMTASQEEQGGITQMDLKSHLHLDRTFADLFIRRITVHADKSIDVEWNFSEADAGNG